MANIYLLSGPIQTGKTTRLFEWVKNRKDVDGILAPIISDERHLLHISTLEKHSLENPQNIKDQVKIGRFKFSKSIFLWAQEKLFKINTSNTDWLIVDEIGPLELEGKGLEPAVTSLLEDYKSQKINILLVIRDGLVQKVLKHYLINEKEVEPFIFP